MSATGAGEEIFMPCVTNRQLSRFRKTNRLLSKEPCFILRIHELPKPLEARLEESAKRPVWSILPNQSA